MQFTMIHWYQGKAEKKIKNGKKKCMQIYFFWGVRYISIDSCCRRGSFQSRLNLADSPRVVVENLYFTMCIVEYFFFFLFFICPRGKK